MPHSPPRAGKRGKRPGVLALFREQFVLPGGIEASHIRDDEGATKRRPMSDYNLNAVFNANDVRVGLGAAQRFTRRIERYLCANGYPQA